jgi:hypothetical protein
MVTRRSFIILLAIVALAVLAPPAPFAANLTEAPVGAHHAGHGPDNGGGRGYTAQVPLRLPAARGGLPIPVTLTVGGTRVGALGRGGDVQLSFISDVSSFAELRPVAGHDGGTVARRRVTLSLLGDSMELMLHSADSSGETWIAQRNHPELTVRKIGPVWRVYAGDGLTYTFNQPTSALQPLGLFLLDRIEGPAGAKVLLQYWIWSRHVMPPSNLLNHPLPLPGYEAVTINLAYVRYNYSSSGSPKHEVILSYDGELAQPISVTVMGAGVLIRNMKLRSIDVTSRAHAMGPLIRLARYQLLYEMDPDTQLPRLQAVTRAGQLGTPEETQELPVVRYEYGRATTPVPYGRNELMYQKLPLVPLPLGASSQLLSSSEKQAAGM